MRKATVIAAALAILTVINLGIHARERLLTDGRIALLELAPVDPRSLMQGDYMALRFKVALDAFGRDAVVGTRRGERQESSGPRDGFVVLALDERQRATFRRFDDGAALRPEEIRMRYRIRNETPRFATNAYFFEEGRARDFANARYGEFRVGPDGESILTALRDAALVPLGIAANR